jgi:hypothetical protein
MDLQEANILFKINSTSYLEKLIPEACRQPTRPSNCTLTIRDRSFIAFGLQSYDLEILVDLNALEQISQHWLVILGCIGGMPEVRIDLAPVPSSMRNSVATSFEIAAMFSTIILAIIGMIKTKVSAKAFCLKM